MRDSLTVRKERESESRDKMKGVTITANELKGVPHLKTCDHWDRATFLGCVICRLQYANVDCGLVKYEDKVYYVNKSQMEALRPWTRWDLRKKVTVIKD